MSIDHTKSYLIYFKIRSELKIKLSIYQADKPEYIEVITLTKTEEDFMYTVRLIYL